MKKHLPVMVFIALFFCLGAMGQTAQSFIDAQKVLIDVKTWSRSTGIAEISFTLKNTNDFAVKDMTIQCDFFGNSGTHIKSLNKILFEKIAPMKTKTIKSFVMGLSGDQAAKLSCAVMNVVKD